MYLKNKGWNIFVANSRTAILTTGKPGRKDS
jgi:hypothetical protein